MSTYPLGRCRRVHLNGARCTMPSNHGGDLCYNHERRSRLTRVRRPILPDTEVMAPLVSFAYMEDHASILHNLNAIAQAFARHQIDHRQVGTLTYLMQTCLKTLRQMNQLETRPTLDEIVTDVVYDDQDLPLAAPDPIPESVATEKSSSEPADHPPAVTGHELPLTCHPSGLDLHAVATSPVPCALCPVPCPFSHFPHPAPQLTPFQTLPHRRKTTRLFSNTCVFERG
jgi:hypothetical protein